MPDVRPFRLDVPDDQLDDLYDRLDRTRWPDPSRRGWADGLPVDYARDLAAYWRHTYDWRSAEQRLNALDQVVSDIDGHPVHALHVRSSRRDAVPIVLLHGWPGSIVEFLDLIPLLTEPPDPVDPAFHVVVPTLPGFGIGGPAVGWGIDRAARAFVELMDRLDHPTYVVHGGDYGSPIARRMAIHAPDRVALVHLTMVLDASARPEDDGANPEVARVRVVDHRYATDLGAYSQLNATRPQSLGYALNDSPVGLMAWIVERFRDWSSAHEVPEEAVDRDLLLTNVMLYWLFGTAASAARYYQETPARDEHDPVPVPAAVALTPDDIHRPLRRRAEEVLSVVRWVDLPAGGHFAALEQPELVAADLRAAVRDVGLGGSSGPS